MSHHRFVTLVLIALALMLQLLGAALLETSKPHHSQVSNSVTAQSFRGEFSPSAGSSYLNYPND